MATAGTWYGLPDLGITEALGIGQGSNWQNPAIPYSTTAMNQSAGNDLSGMQSGFKAGTVGAGGGGGGGAPYTQTPQGAVLGGSTSNGSTSSTSGGSKSYQQQWQDAGHQGIAPVGYHGESTPQNIDEKAINDVYSPTMNYLNQAESAVRADFPNVLDAAQKQYEAAISELSGNRKKNLTTINENQITATQNKEDALSAARRLYDELRRGYQQRFGGSTSAGQAASELSTVEQQRQMGATNRTAMSAMRQIEQQKAQLESDYQTGVAKIAESKTNAIAQAQRDFQNKILEISNQRAMTEGAKAQARLGMLQELRNQAYQAQQQALTYQQNLDMFYRQQQADLQNYAAKLSMAGQGSTSTLQNFQSGITTNPQSSLTMAGTTGQPGTQMTGQISGNKRWDASTGQWVNA